jgi:hypothetical protein
VEIGEWIIKQVLDWILEMPQTMCCCWKNRCCWQVVSECKCWTTEKGRGVKNLPGCPWIEVTEECRHL